MEQITRAELRKIIMTILYQINVYDANEMKYNIDDVIKECLNIDNEFVKDTVYGVVTHKNEIDDIANKNLRDWKITRLGHTDQAILRIGIYELIYTDTPPVVAINESVELAKSFSDDEVRKMINATLDKIYHDSENKK